MKNEYFGMIAVSILCLVLFTTSACNNAKSGVSKSKGHTETIKTTSSERNTNPNSFTIENTYLKMSEADQNKFVSKTSDSILQNLGFDKSEKINGEALGLIKAFVDSYAKRLDSPTKENCRFGDNLSSMLKRGKEVSKDIIAGFKNEKVPVKVGLYLAMIESEFCPCLQSPTGPLGMFQFTKAIAKKYGLNVKKGASPSNPDERCETKPAARASAKYVKSMANEIGSNPTSILIAVAAYNAGSVSNFEMSDAFKKNPKSQESFWKLLVEGKKFPIQPKKYVPKFIAATIVGENPKRFGVDLLPLSQVK